MHRAAVNDSKDVSAELAYQARHAEAVRVEATPEHVIRRYRETRRWRINRKEYIFHTIKELGVKRICDFGCGTGDTSVELAALGCEVVGFDLSPENIEIARQRAALDKVTDRASFVVAHAAESGLPPASFDLVLVMAVLHHVDMEKGLDSLDFVLKPGGYALISEPVAFSPLLQWFRDRTPVEKDISPNERQLNEKDMRQIAARFEVVSRRHFHLTSRLARLFPSSGRKESGMAMFFQWLDSWLLKIPFVNHFAGIVVLLCRKPLAQAPAKPTTLR